MHHIHICMGVVNMNLMYTEATIVPVISTITGCVCCVNRVYLAAIDLLE